MCMFPLLRFVLARPILQLCILRPHVGLSEFIVMFAKSTDSAVVL